MAGLLGLGGFGGMSGGMPAGLLTNPTISQLFDPTAMRNYGIKRGLLDAGVALMNPDPHAPPDTFGSAIGRAAAGGVQGAQKAQDEFYQRGMQGVQLMDIQNQWAQRDKQQAAMDALIPQLPKDIQNFARAFPSQFADAYMRAQYPSGKEFGLNPIPFKDAQGHWHLMQADNRGGAPREMQMPPGYEYQPPTSFQNLGTTIQPVSRQGGGPVGDAMPIDKAGAAEQGAYGDAVGKARANLPNAENAANIMLSTIDSLKSDPYLPNMVGPVAGRMPNLSGDASRVQGKMNQIGGQSFLQAYQFLRGGGAITDVEGEKATAAINRLMTTQDINDYKAALDDLRGIATRAIERARQFAAGQLPGNTNEAPPSTAGSNVIKYDAQGNRVP